MPGRALVATAVLLLAACAGERPDRQPPTGGRAEPSPSGAQRPDTSAPTQSPAPPPTTAPPRDSAEVRPPTLRTTIPIEGFEEPFTLRLVQSPPEFPLSFSTYVPPDMLVETRDDGALAFVANFAGKRTEEAALQVLPDSAPSLAAAVERARAYAAARGLRSRRADAPPRFTWSLAEYDFSTTGSRGRTVVGTVAVARHEGRYFRIVLGYPEEFADGFGPRAARILAEWRWEDGTPLDARP